jgi:anaerobic selenocysteine-containing dehydrogenase
VVTWANTPKTEKALRQLDFLAVMDTFMSRTARLADLVLPAATFLESTNLNAYPGMRTNSPLLQQKVIEPLGEAQPDWRLWFELAKRMGFENDFPWNDIEEAIDYQLEPTGFRAEQLKGHVVVIPKRYLKFKQHGFFTPSKKVELFSQAMADHGLDPLPRHVDPSEYFPDYEFLRKEYPLLGTNYPRSVFYVHSQLRQIAALRKADPEPLVFLHPVDAKNREISGGDRVRVHSPLGHVEMKSAITDRLQPGMLALAWGWGEALPNAGTNELVDDNPRDPMTGTTTNRLFFCEAQKV